MSSPSVAHIGRDSREILDACWLTRDGAVRLRRREQMRLESAELMNDEADRAESRKVLSEMDVLRAW